VVFGGGSNPGVPVGWVGWWGFAVVSGGLGLLFGGAVRCVFLGRDPLFWGLGAAAVGSWVCAIPWVGCAVVGLLGFPLSLGGDPRTESTWAGRGWGLGLSGENPLGVGLSCGCYSTGFPWESTVWLLWYLCGGVVGRLLAAGSVEIHWVEITWLGGLCWFWTVCLVAAVGSVVGLAGVGEKRSTAGLFRCVVPLGCVSFLLGIPGCV